MGEPRGTALLDFSLGAAANREIVVENLHGDLLHGVLQETNSAGDLILANVTLVAPNNTVRTQKTYKVAARHIRWIELPPDVDVAEHAILQEQRRVYAGQLYSRRRAPLPAAGEAAEAPGKTTSLAKTLATLFPG